MGAENLMSIIANVGFPVAITTYLLVKLEKQIDGLTNSVNKLNTIISTKLGVVIETRDIQKNT